MSEQNLQLPNGDTVIIYNERRSLQFHINDLYKYRFIDEGSTIVNGTGQHVANVNDLVYQNLSGRLKWYVVSFKDATTHVVNLSAIDVVDDPSTVNDRDKYLATSGGYESSAWKAYLDTRSLPYRLELDDSFRSYGTKTAYMVFFRGVDTSPTGEVISAYYNQNNEYQGIRIPMDVVANVRDTVFSPLAEIVNTAIKAPLIGYCTKDLNEGELITAVGYSQDDIVQRSCEFTIHKSNTYRRVEDTLRRVTSIQLISPYLSETEPNKLMIPLGINSESVIMRARVNYSDGKSLEMDVGDETSGEKFMLYGFKYWSPTIVGTAKELTLVYRLSPSEEYSREEGESESGLVKESYQIVATEVNPSLALKVFVYPSWMANLNAYVLEYWLFDLLRQQYYRIPASAIEYQQSSRSFDGMDFLSVQTLSISVNLGAVDSLWGTHRHIQTFQVALLRDGSSALTNWRVKHSTNQPAWYGDNKSAMKRTVGNGSTLIDISNGYTTLQDWLDNIFYAQDPLYNPSVEAKAPTPTHFLVTTGQNTFDFPISSWSNELSILNDLAEGQTLTLRFIKRDVNGELQLATVGLPLHTQL